MPCEACTGVTEDPVVAWIDYGIEIINVPVTRLCLEEHCLYRFFYESNLVWKVDHIDCLSQPWLVVQHAEHHYESITPIPGSFRMVPADTPYPVPKYRC